jgi:hypothetical protein
MMQADQILETANNIVRQREEQHGNKHAVFHATAALWSAYLGLKVKPTDVAQLMVLLKVARSLHGQFNPDDYVDACGYAALAAEVR